MGKMINRTVTALFGLLVGGCGNAVQAPLPERLQGIDGDLAIGARGDDVRAVNEYLTRFGYFPNAQLARTYPAWRPLVSEAPADPSLFDQHTAAAISQLQANAGLSITGTVDKATMAVLRLDRCGVPDGITRADPSDKFAVFGGQMKWRTSALTWFVQDVKDVTIDQARAAAQAATATWAAETNLSFSEAASASAANIRITFPAATIDGQHGLLAQTRDFSTTAMGLVTATIEFDRAESWSTTNAANTVDFQTVLLHEVGHGLGLDHSGVFAATMYTFNNGTDHVLDVDDTVAISSLYDTFPQRVGVAQDIGAGADGSLWVIGTLPVFGGFRIHKWNGSQWDTDDNGTSGATRIAVGPTGIPWIVQSNGGTLHKTGNSPFSGSWTTLPDLASDIGVGADGTVWKIGTTAVFGGFKIYKWNGTSWDVDSNGTSGAVRIAVGPTGVPWIVQSNGGILHKSTNSPASGAWVSLPGTARDIGINVGNYAWSATTVGSAMALQVWDEQDTTGGATAQAQWNLVTSALGNDGTKVAVSVGPNGQPFAVNNDGAIFTPPK